MTESKTEERLPCGCRGKCDPFAHDTAWDWDGTPDGPDWSDLSLEERDQWIREHPYCHECGDDLDADDIEMGHRWCKVCAEKPANEEAE